jgi:hypothetical protein
LILPGFNLEVAIAARERSALSDGAGSVAAIGALRLVSPLQL